MGEKRVFLGELPSRGVTGSGEGKAEEERLLFPSVRVDQADFDGVTQNVHGARQAEFF